MTVATTPERRFRSFTDDVEADAKPEVILPLGFDLHGEDFECKPQAQGATLLEFVGDAESGAAALLRFLEKVMKDEDEWTRLNALLHHETKITRIEKIKGIVGFLVEAYSARPTKAS